jgi:DNA-binding NarL/FixJ family response regulator
MFIDDESEVLTPAERNAAAILIVEADPNSRNNLRSTVKSLGYGTVSDVPSHGQALERMNERKFSHILFDAKKTNITPKEFLQQVLKGDKATVCIPTSNEPQLDDVFDLFVVGAKGFLCKPFTMETVDTAIVMASKGEPIAEAVLNAKDRNEALVALMMTALDRVATLLRQGQQFETALREVPRATRSFMRASDLAKTFCKGTHDDLLESIQSFCMDRSTGPATRLGRLRKRLRTTRADDVPSQPQGSS